MRIVDRKVGIGTIYPQAQLHATKQIMTGETGFGTYDVEKRGIVSFMPGSNGSQYHMDNRNGVFHISHGGSPGATINTDGSGTGDIMDILGWCKAVSIGATVSGGNYLRTYPSATTCTSGSAVGGAKLTVSDDPVVLYTNAVPSVPFLDVRPIVLRLERRNVFTADITAHVNLGTVYKLISAGDGSAETFVVQSDGKVNIGKSFIGSTHTDYLLSVSGKIVCNDLRVLPLEGNWPDYVFSPNHKLMSLEEVEKSVKANHHLPGMPSAKEVAANGIDVGEMQRKLLEKMEEMTLYMIELKKDNAELRVKINNFDQYRTYRGGE